MTNELRARVVGRWLWLPLLTTIIAAPSRAAEPVWVNLDQARILKLPERATSLAIGNPLIADVSIQPGGIVVITGKGYGATNMVALDRTGAVLMERMVEVRGPIDPTVVVYKGIDRETYSCTPICSRRLTLGDAPAFFDPTMAQISIRNAQASGAGANAAGSTAAPPSAAPR